MMSMNKRKFKIGDVVECVLDFRNPPALYRVTELVKGDWFGSHCMNLIQLDTGKEILNEREILYVLKEPVSEGKYPDYENFYDDNV